MPRNTPCAARAPQSWLASFLACGLVWLPLAGRAGEPHPPPSGEVPLAVPAAPGDVPLQNPAPASEAAPANSRQTTPPTDAEEVQLVPAEKPGQAPVLISPRRVQTGCSLRDYGAPVERGEMASAIYNTCSGFSLHKPSFLTFNYSPRYQGSESEVIFQFSGKAQVWDFGPGSLYFAYSQKSFFQILNEKRSKAFRESDYNPEIFVRVPKPFGFIPNWSFDAGVEHESNGEDLPNSRSYNRIYFAPVWTHGRRAVQLKTWWRIYEDKHRAITDPKRDDNPDLGSYYGYTELHFRQDFAWNNSLIDVMLRGNPGTGRGAVQTDFSTELGPIGAVFLRVFNGYGESLIDYNRSVTRVGLGIALQR